MAIGEISNREVVIVERSTPISEAAQLMRRYHVGDLVVVENAEGMRRPVGILTDRDIVVEVIAAEVAVDTLTAGDIMSAELAAVRETEGIFETIRYMRDKGVRRLPVVDESGSLVGIVALDDLLELLAEELGALAKLANRERQRESASRN